MAQGVARDVDRAGMALGQKSAHRRLAAARRPVDHYDKRHWPVSSTDSCFTNVVESGVKDQALNADAVLKQDRLSHLKSR